MSDNFANHDGLFAYFGFGSLVNRNTLPANIVSAFPVTLKGWRRQWQARPQKSTVEAKLQSIALLSVKRDPLSKIDGLLIVDRLSNRSMLEEREHAYQKVALNISDFSLNNKRLSDLDNIPVHIHVSSEGNSVSSELYILRSYLDVVLQGYFREFGALGLKRLLATTSGFEMAIHEDRDRPIYPRYQSLTAQEMKRFDEYLPISAGAIDGDVYNRVFGKQ